MKTARITLAALCTAVVALLVAGVFFLRASAETAEGGAARAAPETSAAAVDVEAHRPSGDATPEPPEPVTFESEGLSVEAQDVFGGPLEGVELRVGGVAVGATNSEGKAAIDPAHAPTSGLLLAVMPGFGTERVPYKMPGSVKVSMAPEGVVFGVVYDAAGAVLAKATVRADGVSTQSDNDGAFRLEGLAPGTQKVSASAPGAGLHEPLEVQLGMGEELGPVELRLASAADLRGTIVSDGEPYLAPVTVHIAHKQVSTKDGNFALSGLALGQHRLGISPPNLGLHPQLAPFLVYTPRAFELVAGDNEVQIDLGKVFTVLVKLRDVRGQPVPGAELTWQIRNERGLVNARAVSDEAGQLELPGIAPGSFEVSAGGRGGPKLNIEVGANSESVIEVELALDSEAGVQVIGEVLWSDGTAVSHRMVVVTHDGPAIPSMTDAHGRFRVAGVLGEHVDLAVLEPDTGVLELVKTLGRAGTGRLPAAHNASAALSGEPGPQSLRFNVDAKPKQVRLRVQDSSGGPLSGAYVSACPGRALAASQSWMCRKAGSDAGGIAELSGLDPSALYTLQVSHADAQTFVGPLTDGLEVVRLEVGG